MSHASGISGNSVEILLTRTVAWRYEIVGGMVSMVERCFACFETFLWFIDGVQCTVVEGTVS